MEVMVVHMVVAEVVEKDNLIHIVPIILQVKADRVDNMVGLEVMEDVGGLIMMVKLLHQDLLEPILHFGQM